MILQALYEYYKRCDDLPQKGMELKEIGYLIVIDKEGKFIRLESRMIDKKHASQFLVAQTVQRSGKKYISNYLWDNCEYVTGYSEKNKDKASLCKNAFVNRVNDLKSKIPHSDTVKAISLFYEKYQCVYEVLESDVLWKEMSSSTKNISFLIQGGTSIAAVDEDVINISSNLSEEKDIHICLITGRKERTARIHAKVPLQGNAFTSLVSFKDGKGYDSYGKEQGYNAPVSENAEFAYTTALNHMLRSDSRNKFMIGNRTFLFWASKNDEAGKQAEESIFNMFGFTEQEDDPNKNIEQVKKTFNAIYSGSLRTSLDDKFYILGLAPNSSRIAVTYWSELPLKDFAARILRHFEDMEIADTRKEKKPYMGLYSILEAVTLGGNPSDATPNLPDAVVKSIFQGLSYPFSLFSSCIRRIRAELDNKKWDYAYKKGLVITRAAIIKAYLNRIDNQQKINVMLDDKNTNQGYLCGRLFAVLDKIQDEANNQHSIRERYMNSASATPAAVFATILNLSYHHSEKLNEGRKVWFEKIKQEIVDKISPDGFPAHLDLQDQGRFFVGYYQQTQWFYTKKEEQTTEE
jgi:CRISPR-associated protein Csd1